MKKVYFVILAVSASLALGSCNQNELDQLQKEKDSLQTIVDNKDQELTTLFETLNQIEENLNLVSQKYSDVQTLKRSSLEGDNSIKGKISGQVASIEEMLAANKAKLSELSAKVKSLGSKNAELEAFVARLEERAASQEAQINQLTAELENSRITITKLNKDVSNLNQNVSELTTSNHMKDATIAHQTAEANKAYYIVGSYKMLKEYGVVNKTGGFIGIGKKQATTADMPTDHFTLIDRTLVSTITVNQKGAVVISKHPANSYELVPDENNESVTAYLRILNPSEFWKYTKYLVVSTK